MVIKMKISIHREEWERKGASILKSVACGVLENEDDFNKAIIYDCKDIKINGVTINASAFTVSSRYITFGEYESKDIISGETNQKIGTKYFIDDDKAIAQIIYKPIKTLVFTQEIGTSGRNQTVSIYIKDKYSDIKEMLEEIT